jgi:alpha-L-rhamnosidase
MDGAKRDRTIWTGDLNVVDRTLWDAFGPTGGQYAKGSLTELGDHPGSAAGFFAPSQGLATSPGPMPGACYLFVGGPDADYCPFYAASYSIDFVLDVYDYYLYSGDAAYARAAWPLVKRELAWEQAQVDSSQLFTTDYNDGADWTANRNHHVGDYAATSILHYQSLIDGAALADAVGDGGSGQSYRTQAASAREAINRLLWDQQLGAYDAATSERGFLVQDANVWAVLAGLPSHAQAERILTNLARGLAFKYGMLNVAASAPSDYAQVVSPYIGSSTLWADYQSGRPDLARSLLDTEWGWMVTHDPTGTIWEKIGLNGGLAPFDSAAHGWGTGATSALSQFVLGIQPISPGFHTWRVQPQPSGLTWAQGQVPTAAGALASRWTAGAHNASFRITVSAPPRTAGTVAVPLLGRRRVIAEDGRVVWDRSRAARRTRAVTDGTYVYFTGVTGTHTWAWSSGAGSARR